MILCVPKYFFINIVAYYLNPRFQYRQGLGEDPRLIDAVHQAFNKLDPNSDGLAQFGNEVLLFLFLFVSLKKYYIFIKTFLT